MAIKSTVFKLELAVSDMNRSYYADHSLTIARHPSETNQRMLLRIAAFALHAHEYLSFTKGLSDIDEPDIWLKSLTGDIEEWIELGQPHDKRIRQACGKASRVFIYTYQRGAPQNWFEGIKASLERFQHLQVVHLTIKDEALVDRMVDRSMKFSCMIQDQSLLISNDQDSLSIDLNFLKVLR